MLEIPQSPGFMEISIERTWKGSASTVGRGGLRLNSDRQGVRIEGWFAPLTASRMPEAPVGDRVERLWEFDVVACFLAGQDGRYVEVELGAGGHYLIYSFDGPRSLRDEHREFKPAIEHVATSQHWRTALSLSWELLPSNLAGLGAFACADAELLAHRPVPGDQADFHQPAHFVPVRLERR